MAEYIEREQAISAIKRDCPELTIYTKDEAIWCVESIPAADVAPVVHGHWILEREPNGKPYCFHCSACDTDFRRINLYTKYNYCPDCGAKMDEEE